MGLFSSIASIFSGSGNKKAAQQAAAAQVASAQLGVDETRRQFDTSRADNMPFLTAGTRALGAQMDLLGLGDIQMPGNIGGYAGGTYDVGPGGGLIQRTPVARGYDPAQGAPVQDRQAAAIARLKESPLFQSLFDTGLEATTQNAAATGGLRGGNAQRSFADFGRDTLTQVILQQLGSLGQIAGQGQATGSFLGQLGANAASNLSNLFGQQGQARAGGILGAQAGRNQMISGFANIGDSLVSAIPGVGSFLGKIGL